MTYLFLARHGETDDNARLVFQGQGGKGLNRRGQAQARRLAERLAGAGLTAIVTSDLERARETASIVASVTGHTPELDRGLREVDVGSWTGMRYRDVETQYPEEWSAWVRGLDVRRGGGETYRDLADRVDRALAQTIERHPSGRVLVVSHGGALRSWVIRLLGMTTAEGQRALAGLGNASLTVITREGEGGRLRLHAWNDVAHLEGLVVSETTD